VASTRVRALCEPQCPGAQLPTACRAAVVLGRSVVVGLPVSLLLMQAGASVTNVAEGLAEFDLQRYVGTPVRAPIDDAMNPPFRCARLLLSADVIVAAVGKPLFVRREWVAPGAVVVDVGQNYLRAVEPDRAAVAGQDVVGDVDFEQVGLRGLGICLCGDSRPQVKHVASAISPAVGGLGPVTVCMLLDSTLRNARRLARSGNPR
jgi:5,10-methylene-tetrahydrofolate dehydrogenase/methenyl tetrahydrofolate cyclohydrolase